MNALVLVSLCVIALSPVRYGQFRVVLGESLIALNNHHSFHAPGAFVRRDGNMVLMESRKLWSVTPAGEPRVIATDPAFMSMTTNDDCICVVGGQNLRRVRVLSSTGAKKTEFLLDFNMAGMQTRTYGETLLIVSGSFYVPKGKAVRLFGMAVYHLRTGALLHRFFEVTGKELEMVNAGSNSVSFGVAFDVTPSGTLLVCRSTDYRVYEYSSGGQLLRTLGGDGPPTNYLSLDRTRPLGLDDTAQFVGLKGPAVSARMQQLLDDWLHRWTPTGLPMILDMSHVIVQRGLVPPYDYDVFSLGSGALLGRFRSDKRVLYADRDEPILYMLDSASGGTLDIGVYRVNLSATESVPSPPPPDFVGSVTTFADVESLMTPDLVNGIANVVFCTTPFDCGFPEYYAACSTYAARYRWNISVAVSYDDRSALGLYVARLRASLGVAVLPRPSYVRLLGQAVLIFDRQSHILTLTDLLQQIPLDSFFEGAWRLAAFRAAPTGTKQIVAEYFYIIGDGPCEATKQTLLRLGLRHPELTLQLAPICIPENYMRLRGYEKTLTAGVAHPVPVLVVGDRVLSGEEIVPELTNLLGER